MKHILKAAIVLFSITLLGCNDSPKTFKIDFDNTKEVSGKKFAIKDISPGLPADWDEYNYVVLEFRSTTAQRFHVGFTTDYGYNELRVMSYTANGWNKLAIPLKFYRELPGANVDLAATYNQPRYTGWINLGGDRGPLHGVDSIGIRMRVPIGNPSIEIRSISLSVEDPGDEYLGDIPVVDEFGQWNLGDFEDKIYSLEQLKKEWEVEDNEVVTTADYNYSKYGGYKQKQVKETGFFRTEKIDGKWWFVDPEGYLFLSVGVDCVSSGSGGNAKDIDKRRNMYKELPSDDFMIDSRSNTRQENWASFGLWNLYRRYGEDYREKANDMIIKRMDKWGLNTIANWSNAEVYNRNEKAFMLSLRGVRTERSLMGLADVYAPDYAATVERSMKESVLAQKDNPWLMGYFVANEPAWLEQEERLCGLILDGEDRPIKTELVKFLANGDTPEKRKEFIYNTFRIFLSTVNKIYKKHDPNHLNLGIRFGNIGELDEELLKICAETFDVLSFNCYDLYPNEAMMDRALRITDLPMIIGEYHFGTVDRGMAQSLWQVNSQKERGVAYRYYTEKAYAHPGLIGTAYFQWGDQDLTGRRNDGENYNCGLVDVTDRPYKYQVEAMMETAKRLFDVHSGSLDPVTQIPDRARGHGSIPDLWD
ncbi:hypothetical protein LJC57_03345 [Parabacteroides sp. OttesenSCG-928-G07]|nr:hypothetical protein [Parabacteroides sp. OttesenSCG-928-G07]